MKLKTFQGTDDYNKLFHLPFNRQFSVRQDLIENMNIDGFICPIHLIRTSIIDGKMKVYIADGQHRAITAAFLDITFYGHLVEKVFETEEEIVMYVARLNSGQKPWTVLNYVEAYAYLGKAPYKELLKLKNQTPYSVQVIGGMLRGYKGRAGGVSRVLKAGNFTVVNREDALYSIKLAAKLSKFEKVTARMITAIHAVSVLKSFNEKVFIAKYKENVKAIKDLNLEDYTDVFSTWLV